MDESAFRQGTCAYCGSVGDVTDDHVVPQCLWPGRVRKDVPIVDACRQCNHIWKSEYDTYLRDILVNDRACAKNPIAQKVRAKYYRAASNNRSIMARDLAQRWELVGLEEPSGLISGFAKTLPDAIKRCNVIMPLIVRGLHQFYLHTLLPKDTPFRVARVIKRQEMEALSREMNEKGGVYHNIGDGNVFQFAFWPRQEDVYSEVWILNFYRSIRYVVFVAAQVPEKNSLITSILESHVPFFVSE
jgi:hypothetical protein